MPINIDEIFRESDYRHTHINILAEKLEKITGERMNIVYIEEYYETKKVASSKNWTIVQTGIPDLYWTHIYQNEETY